MKKTLFYCLIFLFFGLSIWQVIRFREKRQDFLQFSQAHSLNEKDSKIFVPKNLNQIYFWKEKRLNIIYHSAFDSIIKDFAQITLKNNIIKKDLYNIHTICGKYFEKKGFTIYYPKVIDGLTRNGYSTIIPLEFDSKIILVKHFWSETKSDVENELKRINNSITVILSSLFKGDENISLKEINNTAMCFTGVLADSKRYYSNSLISGFVKNDVVHHDWTSLSENDLKRHLHMNLSSFFLDDTINNLSNFKREYKHHMFYALMWFCLMVCMIFFVRSEYIKSAVNIKNSDHY